MSSMKLNWLSCWSCLLFYRSSIFLNNPCSTTWFVDLAKPHTGHREVFKVSKSYYNWTQMETFWTSDDKHGTRASKSFANDESKPHDWAKRKGTGTRQGKCALLIQLHTSKTYFWLRGPGTFRNQSSVFASLNGFHKFFSHSLWWKIVSKYLLGAPLSGTLKARLCMLCMTECLDHIWAWMG